MNDSLVMHVFKTEYHTGHHELGLRLREPASSANMVSQVAARQQITDEVQVVSVLECIVDVD